MVFDCSMINLSNVPFHNERQTAGLSDQAQSAYISHHPVDKQPNWVIVIH